MAGYNSKGSSDKVQRAVMMDRDLANMIDQIHMFTGKPKSSIVNDALRTQLYMPMKFNDEEAKEIENLVKSIVSKVLNEGRNKPSKSDVLTDQGPRPEPAWKFEKREALMGSE